jgi:hypothetical protein
MNQRVDELTLKAAELSTEERLELVDRILAGIPELHDSALGVERSWNDEIKARIAAFERGDYELEDVEDVIAEARDALRK